MKFVNTKWGKYLSFWLLLFGLPLQTSASPVEYFSSQRNIDNHYPFSNAVRVGDLLFLSGELGVSPESNTLVEGGIENETRQTMDNIQASLAIHKLTMNDLIKCTVMLADIKEWPTFNHIYRGYFPQHFPARSAFATSGLALNARVEVECIGAFGRE